MIPSRNNPIKKNKNKNHIAMLKDPLIQLELMGFNNES